MHGAVPPLSQYIFIAWCLIKHVVHLNGVMLSYAQGQIYFYLFTLSMVLVQC